MMKAVKIALLLVAVCFVIAEAVPGYYWNGGMDYGRSGVVGPFYMGPYCNFKCSMKCWRMGLTGVCDNYMCTCQ